MPRPDPARPRAGTRRCAVYTRKSSEEGLEQDFNSLHAQREACEAFVRSQKHEGWAVLPAAFDDGGLSGGTMERPALHRLLDDIRAGRVDTVVVYKVDRLTRSLTDFARIVDIFDAHGVAFVSVTQHFNTTMSMGRLTLNVLLSFAQFEREVGGERIRDKIALSKQKGMWMGGNLPLGYDVADRKLVVNAPEAATVRHIYSRYLVLGSVRLLRDELDAAGIGGKRGRGWSRGALCHALRNRLYRGEIAHKDRVHPGQHEAIVHRALWDRVQSALATPGQREGSSAGAGGRVPSLLAGLLFDGAGVAMMASHAVKGGKRYRYYLSRPLLTGSRAASPDALRLPAPEIERVVCDRVRAWLADPHATWDATAGGAAGRGGDRSATPHGLDLARSRSVMEGAAALAQAWPGLSVGQQRSLLVGLVRRVEAHPDRVAVHLVPARLEGTLRRWQNLTPETTPDPMPDFTPIPGPPDADAVILIVPVQLRRIERARKLVVTDPARSATTPNAPLLKLLARAHHLQSRLMSGDAASFADLASQAGLTPKRAAWVLRLSWLAPSITDAILHGRQPASLTADRLARTARLPLDWDSQRKALGFD